METNLQNEGANELSPRREVALSLSIQGSGFSEIELVYIALNRLKKDYLKELLESFSLGDDEAASLNLADVEAIERIQLGLLSEALTLSSELHESIRAVKYPDQQAEARRSNQIEDFKNMYRPKP